LTKIKEKCCHFEEFKDGTSRKNGSFGNDVNMAIVLEVIIKKKESSLATFCWNSALISPLPVKCSFDGEKGNFGVFYQPKRP